MDAFTRGLLWAVYLGGVFAVVFGVISAVALLLGHGEQVREAAAVLGGFASALVAYFNGRGDTHRG
jgi:hypothetical protein